MRPIVYKEKDKVKGIYAYCQKCKTCVGTGKCQKSKKRLSSCQFPEFHTFRASVVVPNTQGRKRKKKILNTKNLKEAIKLKEEFEQELLDSNYLQILPQNIEAEMVYVPSTPVIEKIEVVEDENDSLLIECMDQFVRFLNNEGVEEHKKKVRSKKHIDDVKRYFKYFCLALKVNEIDHTIFTIEQVDDKIVGLIHSYLLNELSYKNKTYNKAMGQYRQFIEWLITDKNFKIKNAFNGVTRRKTAKDDTVITKEELAKLLSVIKPENGINLELTGYRNYYKDWLKTAISIALETGLRTEEFVSLKYSSIQCDENNNPFCIKVENFKVNRIKGNNEENIKDIKTIPITSKMKEILDELNFQENKESDRYLIGADEQSQRDTIGVFTSKAFTHFWKHTGSKRKVNLKHLRKTYLTALVNHFGDKATIISDHADIEVIKKHYTNNEVIMKANQGFQVF